MVCAQVIGNHMAVTFGGAQSTLQLNVFKPLIIHNILQSTRLLADAAESFAANMVDRIEPNHERIADHLAKSLMLVTALNPHIGYDNAVRIARAALAENSTLRAAGEKLGLVTGADFDRWVQPEKMTHPGDTLAP
jgi:fumarate hydratase class II